MLHRQKIAQELDSDTIRQQRGPPDFLTEQFWGTPLREQRGDRTPTALLLRLTGTDIQAGAGESQFAEEGSHANLMVSFASERLLAVGTLTLLFHVVLNLLRRHHLLDADQHLFGLLQPEPKRFWRELISLEAGHFLDMWRSSLLV